MHRESLQRQYSEAGRAQWEGGRTWKPKVPGSIPGARKSLLGTGWERVFIVFYICWDRFGDTFGTLVCHFLVGSGSLFREMLEVLGCVWEWFGDLFR